MWGAFYSLDYFTFAYAEIRKAADSTTRPLSEFKSFGLNVLYTHTGNLSAVKGFHAKDELRHGSVDESP